MGSREPTTEGVQVWVFSRPRSALLRDDPPLRGPCTVSGCVSGGLSGESAPPHSLRQSSQAVWRAQARWAGAGLGAADPRRGGCSALSSGRGVAKAVFVCAIGFRTLKDRQTVLPT